MKPIQLNMFIYGGAFDPMTVGHEGIIRNLVNYVQTLAHQETVYDLDGKAVPKEELDHIKEFATIVYVTNNDEKKYSIPLDNRLRIVEKVVGDLEPLTILPQTERMAATLKTLIADTIKGDGYPGLTEENININLVMGYDEWVSLKHREWVESDWLLNRCNFLVVDRPDVRSYGECNIRVTQSDIAIPVPKDSDLRVKYVNWKVPCVSSTEVRRAMKFNPLYDGKDVPIIVAMELGRLRLLGQDSQKEYDQFEETELKNYTPKKYPKPSVTATTILQYMNKVLLVRRRGFPYHDYWCFPGGFAEPHEDIEKVALREVKEETKLDCIEPNEVIQLGVYTPEDPRNNKFDDYWMYDIGLMVDLTGRAFQQPVASDDAKDAMWVDIEEVKKIPLAFHHKKIFEAFLKRREVYRERAQVGRIHEILL